MRNAVEEALGLHEGVGYHLLSGAIPVLLGFGAIVGWWKRHNCHHPRCPFFQWHDHPDHGHPVCGFHHPHHLGLLNRLFTAKAWDPEGA